MPSYLFRRASSPNWYLRLQADTRGRTTRTVERSLGTPDEGEAQTLARPLIAQHRARIGRPQLVVGLGGTVKNDAIFDAYLNQANLTRVFECEALDVWRLYKTLTNDLPLYAATKSDTVKVVEFFEIKGSSVGTIRKKIGWLSAMCNSAIREGLLSRNPFAGLVPKSESERERAQVQRAAAREAYLALKPMIDEQLRTSYPVTA